MKKENGSADAIVIILIIFLIIISAIVLMLMHNKRAQNENINVETTVESKEQESKETKEINEDDELNSWNGTYEDSSGFKIMITRTAEDKYEIAIMNKSKSESFDASIKNKRIEYHSTFFDTTDDVIINRNSDKISITSNSSDETSLLNKVNNKTFQKKSFKKNGWDGVYVNGEETIVIAETEKDNMRLTVNTVNGLSGIIIDDDYDSNKIDYEGSRVFDEFKIKITKTSKGIMIENSECSDEGDIFNSISKKEFKKID